MTTLLAIDPGVNHFAYSVQRLDDHGRPIMLQRGFVLSTIRTLTSPSALAREQEQFVNELTSLIDEFDVTCLILERYMLRRGSGGTAIESINIMLGLVLSLQLPVKLIPASQWKNAVNTHAAKLAGGKTAVTFLDLLYERVKQHQASLPVRDRLTPHEIDAAHIGWFGWNHINQRSQTFLNAEEFLDVILSTPRVNLGVSSAVKTVKSTRKKRKGKS